MARRIRILAALIALAGSALVATPSAMAASTYAATVMANPNLVSFWRLNEQGAPTDAEGMIAADAEGASPGVYHQAVALGQPGSLEGDPSTAAGFGQPDGYLQMPDSPSLNTSTFTIEGWVNFSAATFNTDVYANGFDSTGYAIQTWNGGGKSWLAFFIGNGSGHQLANGLPVALGQWVYFAGTYDGTTARFYENGQLTGVATTNYVPNSTLPILVSGNPTNVAAGQLSGSVDDLAVYNTALSAATVQQHYQLGIDDGLPPQTSFQSGPSGVTNQTAATFTFTSNSVGPTYQCRLDSGAWQTCSSPYSVSGLANGMHALTVRAVSRAGRVDPAPPSETWTVDTTPPQTSFTSGPSASSASSQAAFTFTSTPGATYTCLLDGEPPRPCSSPYTVSGLVDGAHTLAIVATDPAGNIEPSPAVYSWSVDTASPTTFIIQGPTTSDPSQPFVFAANQSDVTFSCRVDAGPWESCSSPFTDIPETVGSHTFRVEGTDSAGNVDPSDHAYSWTVATKVSLVLTVKFPRQISPLSGRAHLTSVKSRCKTRGKCATARKLPQLSWQVTQASNLNLTVINGRGRRVAHATLYLSQRRGTAQLPQGLLRGITRPGRYTAILQATVGGVSSTIVRVPFTVTRG